MTKIYILAQNPKTEENILNPLAKTKSKERLDRWLDSVLDENKFYVITYGNSTQSLEDTKYNTDDLVRISKALFDFEPDKVIALGKVASRLLSEVGTSHIQLEHPSGLNRNLNDPELEKAMLLRLKEYLES